MMIDIDEAKFKFGLEQHHGLILSDDEKFLYQWDMGRSVHIEPGGINNGHIRELTVWNEGGHLIEFESGHWVIAPDGDEAAEILNMLLDYADGE